jgi:hypothetical protein
MLILPMGSILIDHATGASAVPLPALAGKWFVFWSAGLRLLIAGVMQMFQPRVTTERIFAIKGEEALPIVRELGIANVALGIVGTLSLVRPSFILPMALAGAIFYGLAGFRHATEGCKTQNEKIAMASDLFVSLALAAYVVFSLVG